MNPILNIGVRAARRAGDIILRALNRNEQLNIQEKQKNDFVSEVDRAVEEDIIGTLRRTYPDHGILAEESGQQGSEEFQWIIDPLDGTTNFLHGFPQFSVSIALKQKNRLTHAIIYDPIKDELFTAAKGEGAQLNDRKIRVSKTSALDKALLGTGFPYRHSPEKIQRFMNIFQDLTVNCTDHRRAGSAALDLAYVAAGRLDGFWEMNLQPWDMAAGILLIREAGGMVGDFDGGDQPLKTGDIVAGNTKIFQSLVKTIRKHK